MSNRALTVHAMTIMRNREDPLEAHYPGSTSPQLRAIVATRTKKEAADLFGVALSYFNQYSSPTGNDAEIATATAKPGQVFAAPTQHRSDVYFEITRRPYVSRKRHKLQPFIAPPAQPNFTREELGLIAERFSMANDPVGQSIAVKAGKMLA